MFIPSLVPHSTITQTVERSLVTRILRTAGAADGQILPIRAPQEDLEESPGGLKFKHGDAYPRAVLMLCSTSGQGVTEPAGFGDLVEVTFQAVHPVLAEAAGTPAAPMCAVELMCERSRAEGLTFGAGVPHLVVGSISMTGQQATVYAENLWPMESESSRRHFEAELRAAWGLLGSVELASSKRPAKDLITETPSKRACTGGPLTFSASPSQPAQ